MRIGTVKLKPFLVSTLCFGQIDLEGVLEMTVFGDVKSFAIMIYPITGSK